MQVLRKFTDTMVALSGEDCGLDGTKTPNFVFNELVERLCHCVYERGWYKKAGGCRGLLALCERLPKPWLRTQQALMVKGPSSPRPSSNSTQFLGTCWSLPWAFCGLGYGFRV